MSQNFQLMYFPYRLLTQLHIHNTCCPSGDLTIVPQLDYCNRAHLQTGASGSHGCDRPHVRDDSAEQPSNSIFATVTPTQPSKLTEHLHQQSTCEREHCDRAASNLPNCRQAAGLTQYTITITITSSRSPNISFNPSPNCQRKRCWPQFILVMPEFNFCKLDSSLMFARSSHWQPGLSSSTCWVVRTSPTSLAG